MLPNNINYFFNWLFSGRHHHVALPHTRIYLYILRILLKLLCVHSGIIFLCLYKMYFRCMAGDMMASRVCVRFPLYRIFIYYGGRTFIVRAAAPPVVFNLYAQCNVLYMLLYIFYFRMLQTDNINCAMGNIYNGDFVKFPIIFTLQMRVHWSIYLFIKHISNIL